MILYLVRHGLAAWDGWHGPEDERPLTPQGRQLIEAQATRLARLGLQPGVIFSSPLARAAETASLLAAALGRGDCLRTEPRLRHGFDLPALLSLLEQHADEAEIMLVGHQPDMSRLAADLTGGAIDFREGSVACLRLGHPAERSRAALAWLATPELLTTD